MMALDMIRWSLDIGWDPEHGGIFYFLDRLGHSPEQLVCSRLCVGPDFSSLGLEIGVANEAVVGPQRDHDCHPHGVQDHQGPHLVAALRKGPPLPQQQHLVSHMQCPGRLRATPWIASQTRLPTPSLSTSQSVILSFNHLHHHRAEHASTQAAARGRETAPHSMRTPGGEWFG